MDTGFIKNIVLIGSGNIATSLAVALHSACFNVKQVYSRTLQHAKDLAVLVAADYTDNPELVHRDADLYIIAVSDNAIEGVLKTFAFAENAIVVHTSGSTPIDIFRNYVVNYGVLYPLQTFSKSKIISDFKNIPVFIEAGNAEVLNGLQALASRLSHFVYEINSQQRRALHVSAAFACNFVNYLFGVATDIMLDNKLDKNWLVPLIRETVDKALAANNPHDVQTGPAARGDELTLKRHIDFLSGDTNKLAVYKLLSDSILKFKR